MRGTVHAFDVDPATVIATRTRAEARGRHNVVARQRDLMAGGTGLSDGSAGYAMLFNILHCEHPGVLLREAWRVLVPGGALAIMHWNFDPSTPRGPSMSIRPRPERCRAWALEAGFEAEEPHPVDLPPYRYGLPFRRRT